MKRKLDEVEEDYEQKILQASWRGDDSQAYELSIGLKQYREMYKSKYPEYRD